MKITSIYGPWLSLGVHLDFKHKHLDIHFLWWIIVIGNTKEELHCGYCQAEIGEEANECPFCGAVFGVEG